MIWSIIVLLLIALGTIHEIREQKKHDYFIRLGIKAIGERYRKKTKEPRWQPYTENQIEEDTAFAMPIDMLESEMN